MGFLNASSVPGTESTWLSQEGIRVDNIEFSKKVQLSESQRHLIEKFIVKEEQLQVWDHEAFLSPALPTETRCFLAEESTLFHAHGRLRLCCAISSAVQNVSLESSFPVLAQGLAKLLPTVSVYQDLLPL